MNDSSVFTRYGLFIFDADDTLRHTTVPHRPCPHRRDEWTLMPGVRETLAQVSWRRSDSPRFGIASNQDHVGYGLLSLGTAQKLLLELAVAATDYVPPFPALQLCPHPAEVGCRCRKPEPGMLLAIMRHYAVTSNDTVFVGNEESDLEAATRAGTGFIWSQDFFRQAQ